MIKIRKYNAKDEWCVRKICMDTANKTCQTPKGRELVALLFVDYYLNCEPENVFVAEDEGAVCGYIVCSTNKTLFSEKMKQIYLPKIKKISFLFWIFAKICVKTSYKLDKDLNSGGFHMNIDLQHQGCKLGPKLLISMGQHLLNCGHENMYLVTANSKTRGYGFYTHFGFTKLKHCGGSSIALFYNLNNLKTNEIKYGVN